MKVRGDRAPNGAFSVEPIPKKPGYVLVRLYENPQQFTQQEDGVTVTGWQYDEYHMELRDSGYVEGYVYSHFDKLIAQAREAEGDTPGATIEDRVDALENDVEQIITGLEALAV